MDPSAAGCQNPSFRCLDSCAQHSWYAQERRCLVEAAGDSARAQGSGLIVAAEAVKAAERRA